MRKRSPNWNGGESLLFAALILLCLPFNVIQALIKWIQQRRECYIHYVYIQWPRQVAPDDDYIGPFLSRHAAKKHCTTWGPVLTNAKPGEPGSSLVSKDDIPEGAQITSVEDMIAHQKARGF